LRDYRERPPSCRWTARRWMARRPLARCGLARTGVHRRRRGPGLAGASSWSDWGWDDPCVLSRRVGSRWGWRVVLVNPCWRVASQHSRRHPSFAGTKRPQPRGRNSLLLLLRSRQDFILNSVTAVHWRGRRSDASGCGRLPVVASPVVAEFAWNNEATNCGARFRGLTRGRHLLNTEAPSS
jgi:hypothetical protein